VPIVLDGDCPGWQLSWIVIVLDFSCPGWRFSYVTVVLGGTCPGVILSWFRKTVCWKKLWGDLQ